METMEVKEKTEVFIADYINTMGEKHFDDLTAFLAEDVEFVGPKATLRGSGEYISILRRMGTILLRNVVKRVFVDGNEACIIYDFVTDTEVGAVPTVEWLTLKNGKISKIHLIYDRHRWPEVVEEMNKRLK